MALTQVQVPVHAVPPDVASMEPGAAVGALTGPGELAGLVAQAQRQVSGAMRADTAWIAGDWDKVRIEAQKEHRLVVPAEVVPVAGNKMKRWDHS